jgi:hypothetical protein
VLEVRRLTLLLVYIVLVQEEVVEQLVQTLEQLEVLLILEVLEEDQQQTTLPT